MPSYQKHALFSLIIALPFFHDAFYLSLAVIGASIIDMDHHVKKNNLILMIISGIILSSALYFLKMPFLIGIVLIAMAIIFYISKHRGFVHSIFGVIVLSFLLAFFVLGSYDLFNGFEINHKIPLILTSVILGFIVLNKKLLLPFFVLVSAGITISSSINLNILHSFLAVFLGAMSHIILDLFTPSGISLFNPVSSKKFKKSTGAILFILWLIPSSILVLQYLKIGF